MKDFYNRLEPRDCQLNLDEETMTSIFGPPKKKVPNILISNFVNFAKQPQAAENATDGEDSGEENENENDSSNENNEASANESDKDSNSENEKEKELCDVKQEVQSGDEELEPTDFVSVKIEPMDEEHE